MILTGEAVKYAEEFERVNAELERESNNTRKDLTEKKLTEREQINLYTIQRMAELDDAFKAFIQGCLMLYAEATLHNKEIDLVYNLAEFANRLRNE